MILRFPEPSRKPDEPAPSETLAKKERALAIAFLQRALEVDETRGLRK